MLLFSVEITCVDRPICQKLTVFYKIKSCSTLPHQLRKRAMRKCPKLCGLCVVAEKNEPEGKHVFVYGDEDREVYHPFFWICRDF
jgi:hypothetical protein